MKHCCIKHRFDTAKFADKKRHPRRLPKQHPPIRIEEQYAKALSRIVIGAVRKAYAKLIADGGKLAEDRLAQKRGRLDSDGVGRFGWSDADVVFITSRADYSDDEPRAQDGKWTSSGEGEEVAPLTGNFAAALHAKVITPKEAPAPAPTVAKPPFDLQKFALEASQRVKTMADLKARVQLTPEEEKAAYTWSGSNYVSINERAREYGKAASKYDPTIAALDSAITKATTPNDMVVYRGGSGKWYRDAEVGKVFTDKGFVSTALSDTIAHEFARNGSDSSGETAQGYAGAVIKLHVPAGAHALPIAGQANYENELLLPRGSRFQVTSVAYQPVPKTATYDGGTRAIIEATYLPPEAKTDAFNPDEPRANDGKWTGGSGEVSAVAEAWVKANPNANPDVFVTAHKYLDQAGMPHFKVLAQQTLTPDEGKTIASSYDAAVDDPTNADTRAAYRAFNTELAAQRGVAERAGYKFEPWDKPGQPYANSKEMMKDVREHKHLYYFKSTEGTTPNQMMSLEQNDTFRAVHDLFGHAMGGNQFGPKGETNAFLDHVQMFSPEARKALATETIGQNAWFNFSKSNEGKPITERHFADQKAFLLDPKLYQPIIDRSLTHTDHADGDDQEDYFACPCHRRRVFRVDSPESRTVQGLIADAAQDLRGRTNKPQIAALAKRFAQQTQTYQRVQLNNQVQDVLGVDVPERDPDVADRMSDFVRDNVNLVSSIPQQLHGELASLVHHAVVQGRPNKDLSDDIERRFGVAETRARLIARDQIGKLYADINRHRQRRLGIRKFIWRTMKDERVRGDPDGKYPNAQPSHFDLEGLMFSYDDPPVPEGADGPLLPGEDYQCRCYSEPYLDDLLDDSDDDDESDDEGEDDEDAPPPDEGDDDMPGEDDTEDDLDDEGDDPDDDEGDDSDDEE